MADHSNEASDRLPLEPVDAGAEPANHQPNDPLTDGSPPATTKTPEPAASERQLKTPPRKRSRPGRRSNRSDQGRVANETGLDLERRVARLEFAEGALSRMRVPVPAELAETGRDVLTDIDVLIIDVDLRLRVGFSIIECKSGAGQSGEIDRLFWLAGFQRYLGAQRATLVRTTTSSRGQAVARALGIRTVDVGTLTHREEAHGWVPPLFAHIGGERCERAETKTNSQLRGLPTIPSDLVTFLRHGVFREPSHAVLGGLVALHRAVELHGVLPEPAGLVLASHALVALFLAAIRDAGLLDVVPSVELRRRLGLALTTGSPDDVHVLDVLADADVVVRKIVDRIHADYQRAGAARIDYPLPSLNEAVAVPPKRVLAHYIDLVERLRANTAVARDMLQSVELACFDALVGDEAWTAVAFDHLFTPEHKQLLMYGVAVLDAVCGAGVAVHLKGLGALPFDRSSPGLPDRRHR